jgi:hypothetical protein
MVMAPNSTVFDVVAPKSTVFARRRGRPSVAARDRGGPSKGRLTALRRGPSGRCDDRRWPLIGPFVGATARSGDRRGRGEDAAKSLRRVAMKMKGPFSSSRVPDRSHVVRRLLGRRSGSRVETA